MEAVRIWETRVQRGSQESEELPAIPNPLCLAMDFLELTKQWAGKEASAGGGVEGVGDRGVDMGTKRGEERVCWSEGMCPWSSAIKLDYETVSQLVPRTVWKNSGVVSVTAVICHCPASLWTRTGERPLALVRAVGEAARSATAVCGRSWDFAVSRRSGF